MTTTITARAAGKQGGRRGPRRRTPLSLLVVGMTALACPVLGAAATPPEAAAVTPWASSGHATARLVATGAATGAPMRLAAIEIRLDPGYITYWRNPGEAGLPPTVDTASSTNVAGVTVDFPTPRRLDEGGVTAFGYTGAVALPMHLSLKDAAQPATLVVDLDYAVCSMVCLPAKAHLRLALPGTATPAATAVLAAALAEVPEAKPLGAPGPRGIDGVTPPAPGAPDTLTVEARAGLGARLFVEPPDGWSIDAGDAVETGPGRVRVPLHIAQRPTGATLAGLSLRLTLADTEGAVETALRMDETDAKP